MPDALVITLRWIHIASMTTLLGGMIFWRFVLAPASAKLSQAEGSAMLDRAAAAFRPLTYIAMGGLLLTGIPNYLSKPHTSFYHMLIGIKFLLVGHVFAVAILIGKAQNARRTRMATGAMISGLAILAISAWLRLLSR
jgi:uncharacterized membrane protein